MSFELLSESIRKYIRDKRWEQLRPIQNAAIQRILTTDNHYILASRTASGKTEAAFLPILSKVDFNESGVQVLYISPLIALINDQFYRIEDLCKNMEVTVTKWHGEANKGLKDKLIKEPSGVVLITPESIEAMLVNKPHNVKQLFCNLKFVVIDEIHTFIGSDRGIQLKSLLSRLQDINVSSFRIIGLSATIGDYNEAKKFTGYEEDTTVLLDKTKKDINAVFRYFEAEAPSTTPLALLKDLYMETCNSKALIFPNNRGRAEEIAVKLKKNSERVNGHPNYFSHHSSVHKEVREYVEYFAKNNGRSNFCITCTSTLELGIDIGNVDEVVQIDATNSIASLIQRVGRSGRREGATSNLFLYATEKWSLLQSIACWLLYKEGYIEPPAICEKPYDLLLHQG
ncbi:MAG: DEAD/DEAH box helicase, partial [Chryseobacterium taeanense]